MRSFTFVIFKRLVNCDVEVVREAWIIEMNLSQTAPAGQAGRTDRADQEAEEFIIRIRLMLSYALARLRRLVTWIVRWLGKTWLSLADRTDRADHEAEEFIIRIRLILSSTLATLKRLVDCDGEVVKNAWIIENESLADCACRPGRSHGSH